MFAITDRGYRPAERRGTGSGWRLIILAASVLLFTLPAVGQDDTIDDDDNIGSEIAQAFTDGSFDLQFRYRYEYVDRDSLGPTDPVTDSANASTLRTRLEYRTAEFRNLSLTLGLDDVRPVFSSDFNDTRNGKTQYPIVVDPKGTDLNLASLTFTGLNNTQFVLGRQRIQRGNLRFIGGVEWRQNEQTYDSVSVAYSPSDKLKAFYSHVSRVKRIFGPDSGVPSADFSSSTNLLDVSYSFGPLLNLFGYGYWLDLSNRNEAAPAQDLSSSQTFGLRLTGNHEFDNKLKLGYAVEYASQQDYADNPINYDADYSLLEATLDWSLFGVRAGYEVLEGNGQPGESFQTPLATGHKFNGWADRFLATPSGIIIPDTGGLEDFYIAASANILKGKWSLIYHDFSPQTGSGNYGDELDFSAKWSFGEHYSVLAKFALYNADTFLVDTDKFWVMLTASF